VSSLILPALLLVIIAFWGVFSAGRKFKKEFQRRGITWEEAAQSASAGAGVLVVDIVYGPPRGLGHPTLWFLPSAEASADDLAPLLEGTARIVRVPKSLRRVEALRKAVPEAQLRGHGLELDRRAYISQTR
jgi:hypothetical protein